MTSAKVYLIIFLCWGLLADSQNVEISENCLRCICHSRSGCFFIRNCANYSIRREYWVAAGRPTVLDDSPDDPDSYENCKKDDNCIMRTMRGYIIPKVKDCDCDGKVDCKDYAAIHLNGDACSFETFDPNRLARLDRCLADRRISVTPGWNMRCTPDPV